MLSGCGAEGAQTTLVVRTTLPDELQNYVEMAFEAEHPTVDVVYSSGGAAGSFHELQVASDIPPFDVWWGAPATMLERAAGAGFLAPHRPRWVSQPGVGEPSAEEIARAEGIARRLRRRDRKAAS